jgi:ADP-ribose pyrophosphatase YjhB (NUDIX family)
MPLTPLEAGELTALMDKTQFHSIPLPGPVFFAWCRNFYANSTELAIVRTKDGRKEVFLNQRPASDPFYAHMWHMPGAICLPGKTFSEAALNCLTREVGVAVAETVEMPETFRKHWDNVEGLRGHTNQFLYLIELTGEQASLTEGGKFFPIDAPPLPLVPEHIKMIAWLKNHFL